MFVLEVSILVFASLSLCVCVCDEGMYCSWDAMAFLIIFDLLFSFTLLYFFYRKSEEGYKGWLIAFPTLARQEFPAQRSPLHRPTMRFASEPGGSRSGEEGFKGFMFLKLLQSFTKSILSSCSIGGLFSPPAHHPTPPASSL